GEGRVEFDRAMDTLRRAVAAGYNSFDWMRRDPDLDPLRSRPDFQLLMMDLAMPAGPLAPASPSAFPRRHRTRGEGGRGAPAVRPRGPLPTRSLKLHRLCT